jgi:hypothetical protein
MCKWLLVLFSAVMLRAETLDLTFSGYQESIRLTITGSGSITFNNAPTVNLADVTGFNFTINDTQGPPGGTEIYNLGLADLIEFNATLDGDGDATTIDLGTRTVDPNNIDSSFWIESPTWGKVGGVQGVVDPSVVSNAPEPVTLALVGLALVGIATRRRKNIRGDQKRKKIRRDQKML